MALLSIEERKEFFKTLGLGEYNEENIEKLQKKYMLRKKDVDGKYGNDTDNLLRHLMNCHLYLKKENFKPEEFRCGCGGKHCCGYPTYMKPMELKNIQSIRSHYGKPMIITCGVRCVSYNRAVGGIQNSEHLKGLAVDYYIQGVTDTLANRKRSIQWIKTLPGHHYTYGNGINSNGYKVNYPGMGNALHTDSYDVVPSEVPAPTPSHSGELIVDGIGGKATVIATQRFFDCIEDGVISSQNKALQKYYPSLIAVEFSKKPKGSACIRALQSWLGVPADGIIGVRTVKAWQRKLGINADGIFGKGSMKAWQKFLNKELYPIKPIPTKSTLPSDTVVDISDFQDPPIDWAKAKADGVKGAIIRCGYRSAQKGLLKEDKHFFEHIKAAYEAGAKVGIYMFTEGITAAEGRAEADFAIRKLKEAGVPISYPIGVDTERVKVDGERARNLSKAQRTAVIKAFCERIIECGYEPMIYASTSWLNNKLDISKLPYKVWCAQYASKCEYKGAYIMWQYTSDGKIDGYKGRIDMNHCYLPDDYSPIRSSADDTETKPSEPINPPTEEETKPQEPITASYGGEMPTLSLNKTNAEVIEDTIRWLEWIANDNNFHYGYGKHAHHNGCYFCGTEAKYKKGHGIVDWEKTYCCNPFIGAGWAHGGCVPEALKMCQKCDSYDFHQGKGYDKSKLFDNLGKIAKEDLKRGDVLCRGNGSSGSGHVMLYLGNGKVIHAHGGDNNVKGSDSWEKSINIESLGNKKYQRVHRFNSTVNTTQNIYFGEVSKRVENLQHYLIWYGYAITADGIFGDQTHNCVKDLQRKLGQTDDGIVGTQTLEAMAKVVK